MEIIMGILILPYIILVTLYQSFVGWCLYNWYIEETFNAPSLSIIQSFGIMLLIRFITYQHMYVKDDRDPFEKVFEAVAFSIIYPCIILVVGAIGTLFL